MSKLQSAFAALPFVTEESDWVPDRAGDYAENCGRGREYADRLIALMRDHAAPPMLRTVFAAISRDGDFEAGVEIGFASRLASRAIA